jgi:hypothetical protein
MIIKLKIVLLFIIICVQGKSQSYIIVGDTSSNYITYNNIKDTIVPFIVKGSFSIDLDINYDGINDIRFYRAHSSSPSFSQINLEAHSLDSIQFIRTIANLNNCDTLMIGDTIHSTSNWNNNYNYGNFYYSFSGPPPPWGSGNTHSGICSKNNTYIGFRKINTNDTIYGWFLLDFQGTYNVKSYAINKRLNIIGINELKYNSQFDIYPNPSNSKITIDVSNMVFTEENKYLSLKNALGQVVLKASFNSKQSEIDVSNFSNGIYFIEISLSNNLILNKKIVINR